MGSNVVLLMLLAVIMDHQMADQVVQGSSKDLDQPETLIDVDSFFESVSGDGESMKCPFIIV